MREYELEVLEQYDIEVRSTRKIRGAFFCDTDQGGLLLKEVHFSEKRAPLLYQLCLQLKEEGFERVDLPVLTKEGNCLSVYRDGTHYLLKHWFTGRDCEVRIWRGCIKSCSGGTVTPLSERDRDRPNNGMKRTKRKRKWDRALRMNGTEQYFRNRSAEEI